jgi:hypothetical protein
LGPRVCGLKLAELAEAVGLKNDAVVATNAKRAEQARMSQVSPVRLGPSPAPKGRAIPAQGNAPLPLN